MSTADREVYLYVRGQSHASARIVMLSRYNGTGKREAARRGEAQATNRADRGIASAEDQRNFHEGDRRHFDMPASEKPICRGRDFGNSFMAFCPASGGYSANRPLKAFGRRLAANSSLRYAPEKCSLPPVHEAGGRPGEIANAPD